MLQEKMSRIISFCFYEEKFHAHQETERGDKFRREKRRNGVLQ